MKLPALAMLLIVSGLGSASAAAQTPAPQPPTDRTGSPYDQNPACRDREVASTDPACVIQNGEPAVRHFGFDSTKPQPAAPVQLPQGNPAPPAAVSPRESATRQ